MISGYCAIGSVNSATPPASVTMIDSTEAKIGRSMKNLENKASPYFVSACQLIVGGGSRGSYSGAAAV